MQRKYRIIKQAARLMLLVMAWEVIAPVTLKALTSGPSQPEVQQFTPAGVGGMVDPFTGDFQYSIPLLELPGPNGSYPFVLGYQSGITMDQEASWVGLGWNLNVGAITRNMRGLPDEFAGDVVEVDQRVKPDITVGVDFGPNYELFGADFDQLGLEPLMGSLYTGIKIYHNSYRGWGYSLDVDFKIGSGASLGRVGGQAGAGLKLDSQEGVGFSAALGLTGMTDTKMSAFHGGAMLGANYNSRQGLTDLGLDWAYSDKKGRHGHSLRGTFSKRAFVPKVQTAMTGYSLNGLFKTGLDILGSDLGVSMGGFYSEQRIADEHLEVKAYGYQNLEQAQEADMMDFNRSQDGVIRPESPNLATPVLTNDVYQISGQGVGGAFRAWRNDVGIIHDRRVFSASGSQSIGGDVSAGGFGLNFSLNNAESQSGRWTDKNNVIGNGFGFQGESSTIPDYEPWYFKAIGEGVTDPLNDMGYAYGDQPVRIMLGEDFDDERRVAKAQPQLTNGSTVLGNTVDPNSINPERRSRNMVIQGLTNEDLAGTTEAIGAYQVEYYQADNNPATFSPLNASNKTSFNRNLSPSHHFGGMTAQMANGMQYNYALPVKNAKHIENTFSVDGSGLSCSPRINATDADNDGLPDHEVDKTDEFLNRQELPEYAHSYLLTSVLGQDYVDADDIPGPSDGDLGFWVKFNYVRTSQDYKWRSPFVAANLDRGQRSIISDDRASYLYGEREQWYLASAETKTHLAEFKISRREDGRGAKTEFQEEATNASAVNLTVDDYSYQLDTISLYSKIELQELGSQASPIQQAIMEYDQSLCQGAWNNAYYDPLAQTQNSISGKLTLKSVHFVLEESSRGALNKYDFSYGFNPDYDPLAQDKWGYYKPYTSECEQFNYPYVDNREARSTLDLQASAWNLDQIDLPTGGKVDITYEADDYGYVQNKPAMRMFDILRIGSQPAGDIYDTGTSNLNLPAAERRIYFKTDGPVYTKADIDPYAKGLDQLYIKALIDLKKANNSSLAEFVPAYFEIEDYGVENPGQSEGYITLAPSQENNGKWTEYHPLSLAAWHYLRANLPQLVATPLGSSNPTQGSGQATTVQRWRSLVSMGPEIIQIFLGYYLKASLSKWAATFDPANSWIRLNDPDHNKVGGGCRVKMITMDDRWGDNPLTKSYSNLVGIVYDYTTTENGMEISSGVAQYEPMLGGDENPLKTAKSYPASTKLRSPNNLFFEYPINEPYMPAPLVGYSKVTVKSLATQQVLDQQLSATIPTTGAEIHEFYTSRDYPVLTSETPIEIDPFNLWIPIPFVGSFNFHDITASQGYSIVLNDMHGKPRRNSNYGMTKTGELTTDPISWVEYNYLDESLAPDPLDQARQLRSKLNVLLGDVDPNDYTRAHTEARLLGQDHEFFLDMRESYNNSWGAGILPNLDFFGLFAVPTPWPLFSHSKSRTRTVVANKIIRRSGILNSMTVYNEGSKLETRHNLYDAQTGRPLLSEVDNNYGDPVYSYQHPAFWAYSQMGPAYKNIGLEFEATGVSGSNGLFIATGLSLGSGAVDFLVPGDEMIVSRDGVSQPQMALFTGFTPSGDAQFFSRSNLAGGGVGVSHFKIVRSGRRNILGADATQITALKDPTHDRDTLQCWRDLAEPATVMDTVWSVDTTVYDTVPDGCVYNWRTLVNSYLNSGQSIGSVSGFLPISDTAEFCLSADAEIFVDQDTLLTFQGAPTCVFLLLDGNGIAIDWNDVNVLGALDYAGAAPFPNPANYDFTNITSNTVVNGQSQMAWIYGQSGQTCQFDTTVIPTVLTNYYSELIGIPNQTTRVDTLFMVDSVLSASAQTFSDAWSETWEDLRFESGNGAAQLAALQSRHAFANGQRGIWRAKRSYVYVDDRQQTPGLNTRKDGTFSGLPMFNFHSNFFESCGQNWRRTNEVTRYSPYSYELENRDVLNIYSAALYGYNGKLPTAVVANADYREIGFESFEEYEVNATVDVLGLGTGNLDFQTDFATLAPGFYEYGEYVLGDGSVLNYDQPLPGDLSTNTDPVQVQGRTQGSLFDPAVNFVEARNQTGYSSSTLSLDQSPYLHGDQDSLYTGWVGIFQPSLNPIGEPSYLANYSDDKAHTGKMSFKWEGNLEWFQNRLSLDEDELYTVQSWVSRSNIDMPFYRMNNLDPNGRLGLKMQFYDGNQNLLGSSDLMQPSGEIVEGWQKVEGEFRVPSGCTHVSIVLQSGKDDNGFMVAYLDDIRLQPKVSNMTCYVYDTDDYRIRATLDDDNYALIYHYAEGGNLFLIQKETVEGMRTLQESRGFLAQ